MGRSPCCAKEGLNRGAWTAMEDKILTDYIRVHGEGKWRNLPKRAGLKRCGKSCRLRWLNYLRPDIKRGNITNDEEDLIVRLHKLLGNRWSLIAGRLPGRTDNEIKNYWNTNIGKKFIRPSNQSKEKSNQKIQRFSSGLQPATGSSVVRTKATRCTKVFIRSDQAQNSQKVVDPKPEVVGASTSGGADCGGGAAVGPDCHVSQPFVSERDDPSDFIMDFEMDDKFLSDFLNSDFPLLCDEDVDTNSSSSPNSTPTLFSGDSGFDSGLRIGDEVFDPSELPSMAPLLDSGVDWLQD